MAVDAALAEAARRGFRLAMIGRACALVPIAAFYVFAYSFPNNIVVPALVIASAGIGLAPLLLARTRFEQVGRYALFTFDAAALTVLVAVVPISSGGDIPQNMVFLISRAEYFVLLVGVSALTLSPALVLSTGACAAAGLLGATVWIAAGMERVVSFNALPPKPTRDDFLKVALDPDFIDFSVHAAEAGIILVVTGLVALAVARARRVVRAHAASEEGRARIRQLFGRYVPVQVAEELIDEGQLAPQQRTASILFADIEGFTHLSESLSPPEVIAVMDSFFGAATGVVDEKGGVVVNYVGDALIAAFNAPLPVEAPSARAVEAAQALLALVASRQFEGHRLQLRVGVATGPVAGGTVGGSERRTYTLYGDTVNLAQRLEELNKTFGTRCLVCGVTFQAAAGVIAASSAMGEIDVRGRDHPVDVYALGEATAPGAEGQPAAT